MIDRQTVDRIIDAANIYDVVSEYVSLRRSGASYKGLCPFHDDQTPSFYVNPARGICKCFSCGKGGTAVSFIMEIEQMTFPEALKHLAKKYNIEVKEKELSDEDKKNRSERESMLAVNEWAANFFHNNLLNTEEGKNIGLAYFRSRGFRDDIIEKFMLGYAFDSWDALSTEAKKKGFKDDFLIRTSLAYKKDNGKMTDKFRGRVMFPWFSLSGQVLAFGGRVLDARTKGVSQKYINSNDSEIYHKHRELYGLFQAKKQISKEQLVYMVEGYTDVLAMHQAGIENVVANSGTALNDAQILLLKRFTDNITLIYDSDEAGIHAAMRGTDMLLSHDMNVKVMLLPEGEDPDSFVRTRSSQEFRDYVKENQKDFIIFKINQLYLKAQDDPRTRSEVTESILQSIAVINSEITRTSYIHECSQLMGIQEDILMRRYMQIRENNQKQAIKDREREQQRQEYLNKQAQENEDKESVNADNKGEQTDGRQKTDYAEQQNTAKQQNNASNTSDNSQTQHNTTTDQPVIITKDRETENILGTEKLIMRMIVRYGECTILTEMDDQEPVDMPIAVFVRQQLDIDQMDFITPVYRDMLNDVVDKVNEEGFSCSKYFLTSPDIRISNLAADMLNDKYRIDKSVNNVEPEINTLAISVPRLVLDFKYFVIKKEMIALKRQLADKQLIADSEKIVQVMRRYKLLSDVQVRLAKQLGDRIIH